MSTEHDELDRIIGELLVSKRELDEADEAFLAYRYGREPVDSEVREPSKHESTDWLSLADSICHDPWRRRP
jgi:hypothetical protein